MEKFISVITWPYEKYETEYLIHKEREEFCGVFEFHEKPIGSEIRSERSV